jgi:DNA-binding transcriptional LysR family regulator
VDASTNTVDWLGDAGRVRAFLTVVETGGFSRAARALGTTQPTVSSAVAGLEGRLGARLLTRDRAGVRLTAAGTAFVPHAHQLLAVAERAGRAVAGTLARERRHLAVAGGEALVTYALPPALARLRGRLPGLEVTVTSGDPARLVAALAAGEVACVLAAREAVPAGLPFTPVGADPLVFVASPGHPLADGPVPLARLGGERLVVREEGRADRGELERLLRAHGARPAVRHVVAGLEAAKRTVAAGLGLALVPALAVADELAAGRLVALDVAEPLPSLTWGVLGRGPDDGPLVAALIEALCADAAAAAHRLTG